jgi:hypothetical protein
MIDKTVREAALLFGAVHFVCGALVVFEPAVIRTSALASFWWLFGDATTSAGTILMLVGAMAILGSRSGYGCSARLLLIGPQQIVLAMQIFSISAALLARRFPDGYVPEGGGLFILADQLLFWALCAAHTAMYFAEWTRTWGNRGPHI